MDDEETTTDETAWEDDTVMVSVHDAVTVEMLERETLSTELTEERAVGAFDVRSMDTTSEEVEDDDTLSIGTVLVIDFLEQEDLDFGARDLAPDVLATDFAKVVEEKNLGTLSPPS